MYQVLKPFLFQLPAERAHHFTVKALHQTLRLPGISAAFRAQYKLEHASLERNLFGLRFPNPIGLAAGFDKDGKYYHDMAALGFRVSGIGYRYAKTTNG